MNKEQHNTMTSANANASKAFLASGGPPTAKFPNQAFGTVNSGVIIAAPTVEQQRDYDTGEALTYSDGNPKMQMVVTIQTDQRDPAVSDDDGKRRLFVRSGMRAAVQKAVQAAKVDMLDVGGTISVTYTHDDGRAKQYTAVYTPPNKGAEFLGTADPAAAPGAAAGVAAPAAAPAAPAGLPEGVTPEALQALAELGMLKQ